MLQQTVVATVIPYFQRFVARYSTIQALAAAPEDEVLGMWAGLGYYARARNLIACARVVAAQGGFPETIEELRGLPGIGAYTAAAIGAIAFGVPVVPMDGNVERVVARIHAIETPLPQAKAALAEAAARLIEDKAARGAPGDFAQALFDLGATICTPRNPSCLICPWQASCAGRAQGIAAELPHKAPKTARPARFGTAYVMRDEAGRIGLQRRPPQGLLGGMLGVPGSIWAAMPSPDAPPFAPDAVWRDAGMVRHVFTHFTLELRVLAAPVKALPETLIAAAAATPLPTVMRKAVTAGLAALDLRRQNSELQVKI
jgi:A/G-specific adenine glycosylase